MNDGIIAQGAWQHIIEQWDAVIRSFTTTGRVLLIPPDISRIGTGAGILTAIAYARLSRTAAVDILPALGTHAPMNATQLTTMFGTAIPPTAYLTHDCHHGVEQVGTVSAHQLHKLLELSTETPLVGLSNNQLPIMLNRALLNPAYHHIISIGTVAPHAIVGFSNHCKNILIGCGGTDLIAVTHYYGARIGVNNIITKITNPIRRLLAYIYDYMCSHLPIGYALLVPTDSNGLSGSRAPHSGSYAPHHTSADSNDVTAHIVPQVVTHNTQHTSSASVAQLPNALQSTPLSLQDAQLSYHYPRSAALYWSNSTASFADAARHAHSAVVIEMPRRYATAVAYMPTPQYTSLWVANKAIYRLNQLLIDGGKLIIIAPGVTTIAHPSSYRSVVEQFGYTNTERIVNTIERDNEPYLIDNLAAVAHCIHGDAKGRYRIIYATPSSFAKTLRTIGFSYLPLKDAECYLEEPQRTNPPFATGTYHTANCEQYYFATDIGLRCWKWGHLPHHKQA